MSSFKIPNSTQDITVTLPKGLTKDQLSDFRAWQTWLQTLQKSLDLQRQPKHPFHDSPYKLRSIEVQAGDFFSEGRLGFVKLKAEVTNDSGEHLPGAVFLRGGSVAMLLILQLKRTREEYAILTVQPRIAAGSMGFVELPAGMLDDSGTFAGAAAKEIEEETGLKIEEGELVDMTKLTLEARRDGQGAEEEHLQQALYASPGGSDEFIPIFLARKKMSREEIEGLKGKLTGLRDHGEKITLQICKLDDVWKLGAHDGKTLAAIALYEGLKRESRL